MNLISERIVNLGWYNFALPSFLFEEVWTHLFENLRREGVKNIQNTLNTCVDIDKALKDPSLLLSQTCGYDIPNNFPVPLKVVAVPEYEVPGCQKGFYSSFIVSLQTSKIEELTDLPNARLVINSFRSYSGYHSLIKKLNCSSSGETPFSEVSVSGSHKDSLEALHTKKADVACIDRISWRLFENYEPRLLRNLRVIEETEPAPAPPLVAAIGTPSDELQAIQRALFHLFENSESALACQKILWTGIQMPSVGLYNKLTGQTEVCREVCRELRS